MNCCVSGSILGLYRCLIFTVPSKCISLLKLLEKKCYTPRGLNNRNWFPQGSRGWKFNAKVLADLVSGESSFPGLEIFTSLPYVTFPP